MAKTMELTENQKAYLQIQTVTSVFDRARNLELAKIGLNIPQAQVLNCLKISKEPMTPMKLSRMMHKQPHTVSALIHRMEVQGLVSTKKDMERKNWVRVSLTKKGDEAYRRWSTSTKVPDALSVLSKKEKEALRTITQRLHWEGLGLLREMQRSPYDVQLFWE